jgi:hypothetical protein
MIRTAALMFVAVTMSLPAGDQTSTSSQSPLTTGSNALALPAGAFIFAKLTTNLDLQRSKPGDVIEAQIMEDVKQGKEVLLKKGGTLLGHVSLVEPATAAQPETMIGIMFDGVKAKNGPQQSLLLLIHALAPESDQPSNSNLSEGRGMPGATTAATVPGGASAGGPAGGRLTTSSVGVSGIPNTRLEIRKDAKGQAVSIVAFSKVGVTLKKGTQLLLTPPSQ